MAKKKPTGTGKRVAAKPAVKPAKKSTKAAKPRAALGSTPPRAPKEPPRAPKRVEFSLILEDNKVGAEWAAVRLSDKVHAQLGGDGGRIPIAGTADGFPIRTSAMPMGGHHWFVFNREMRDATGKRAGDRVKFCIWRDLEPRTIDTPPDLRQALRGQKAIADFFEKMSFSHRKEVIAWIDDAKQAQTRARRVAKATAALAQKHAERIAKDAAGIAAAAAGGAAREYEGKLHKAAIQGANAIEVGATAAVRALRGLVHARQKSRKGGGL